jgi:hypothetical protein
MRHLHILKESSKLDFEEKKSLQVALNEYDKYKTAFYDAIDDADA